MLSVGAEFATPANGAAFFPGSFVIAGENGEVNYEMHLGSGVVKIVEIGTSDAAGTTSVRVRVWEHAGKQGDLSATGFRSRDGFWAPGASAGIVKAAGGNAVVGDTDVVDIGNSASAGESRWQEDASAIGAPNLLASFLVPVNTQQRLECCAHAIKGIVVEVVGLNAGTPAVLDRVSLSVTYETYRMGASRVLPRYFTTQTGADVGPSSTAPTGY